MLVSVIGVSTTPNRKSDNAKDLLLIPLRSRTDMLVADLALRDSGDQRRGYHEPTFADPGYSKGWGGRNHRLISWQSGDFAKNLAGI